MTTADTTSVAGGAPVAAALARMGAAALSLSLAIGLAVWGWELVVREAVGVPLIRAEPGPMRIAPEAPGGARAEHQGLSVSRIAAGAAEAPLANELRLAPLAPGLSEEDRSAEAEAVPVIAATDLAVAEALGLDAASLVRASAVLPPRPEPRPAVLHRAAVVADLRAPGELVQLGAYGTPDAAETAWVELSDRFAHVLDGRGRRIERVERGGSAFWRLRAAGFEDLDDARRVCAALMAAQAECIPVVRR